MCHKIRLFNFHFKVIIIESTIKVKILPNITKFYGVDFEKSSSVYYCFRRHVCLSNLKQAPSRKLPLTACKTVFSHLKYILTKKEKGKGITITTIKKNVYTLQQQRQQ